MISKDVDIETIDNDEIQKIVFQQKAEEFAIEYRAHILAIKKNKLPDFVDSNTLRKGECEVPAWLNSFWLTALSGFNNKLNDRVRRLASTYSQDSIYSITRGNIKPSKQIMMGLAMKSITGNKKVLSMLYRQGYSISYSNAAELETSAAYSSIANNSFYTSDICPTSTLASGVAWNNFDRYVIN